MKRVVQGMLLVVVFSLVFVSHGYATHPKPPTATSYYVAVNSTEPEQDVFNWLYWRGYELGRANLATPGSQYSLVFLMFGRPEIEGSTYGVSGYDYQGILPVVSVSTIEQAVEWFGWGYKWGAGNDTQSFVGVMVATSNDNSANAVTYNHGQQWSLMVKLVDIWFGSYVRNSGHQIYAYGGIDAEPNFSPAINAKNWVEGYGSVTPTRTLINFGSADGCPPVGSCNNGWTQENIYWLSEGAPASCCSMPQIYNTQETQAKQWQQLSLYAYSTYGSRMTIYGPLSQYAACLQTNDCSGTNNTPDQAWNQLRNWLNTNQNTAQDIWYSSDIKWR